MTRKATLKCVAFKPLCRGSLRGFASIAFVDLRMTMHSVAIHHKDGSAWAQPPSQAWVKDGNAITDDRGKVIYSQLIEFESSEVRRAWSDRVVAEVLRFDPRALVREHGAAALIQQEQTEREGSQ